MEINGEKTVIINGKHFWTIRQFSKLTGFAEPRIRSLIYSGNSQRKLKAHYFASNKPMVHANELFDFPFVLTGRPSKDSKMTAIKYYLEEGELSCKEIIIEK
jgi:hypothetical protein